MPALWKRKILVILFIPLIMPIFLSAAEHPSLFFFRSDLPELKALAKGAKRPQFETLERWGRGHLEEQPPSGIGTDETKHERVFSTVMNYGLLYQLTGKPEYLAAGRKWLDTLLEVPAEGGSNYHIGTHAASLAVGYDLFYSGFSARFRGELKAKLIAVLEEARRGATHPDYAWWAGLDTHHDFWIPVAFMGLAALSLKGEYHAADSVANLAVSELSRAMGLLGDQGYWPEGVADWVYGMAPTLMFFDALARAGGRDFSKEKWLSGTARVRIQHWLPDDRYMYIGDSYPSGRYGMLGSVSGHVLMRLASLYRDSQAQWLALREAVVDTAGPPGTALEDPYQYGFRKPVSDRIRHGLAWQFLWYDPSLSPVPPDTLATDVFYSNWDSAIFRSGWETDDPVLFLAGGHLLGRSGTNTWRDGNRRLQGGLAHTHQNAGSIYLWADRHFVISPPGYGGRDGRFHSTVMVDGHGQLFQPEHTGRMTAFESAKGWAMAAMELTRAYPRDVELDEFQRTLVYLKPRTIILFDRLVTRDGDKNYIRRYEWLLHTDASQAGFTASGDSFFVKQVREDESRSWLSGRIFPSARHFFEYQSMDKPNGTPLNRALSVTLIGQVPVLVEIAAVLELPSPGGNAVCLGEIACLRDEKTTTLFLPEREGTGSRTVIQARGDTVEIASRALESRFLLVVGLAPGGIYRQETLAEGGGSRARLVSDPNGELTASREGNLVLIDSKIKR